MIAKFAPNNEWGSQVKYYFPASTTTTKVGTATKVLFTASTDAFIYIILDNNWTKWIATAKFLKKAGNWKATLPKQKPKVFNNATKEWERPPDIMHDAKYTSSDGGQVQNGTFKSEGIKLFSDMMAKVKAARKDNIQAMVDMENKFLPLFRDMAGKPHQRVQKSGKKKRKSAGDGHSEEGDKENEFTVGELFSMDE